MLKSLKKLLPISSFKNGDTEAFSTIYGRFRIPILNYISGRISNPDDQEEVVQEIFLKAFRFRHSYDQTYAFSTWLWTLAKHTTFDWLRKNRTHSEGLEEDTLSSMDLEAIPSTLDNAETLLGKKFDLRNLIRLTKHLTRLQRKVLWLRFFHHLSHEEISKRLGISLSAVKNLTLRARATLTGLLHADGALAF